MYTYPKHVLSSMSFLNRADVIAKCQSLGVFITNIAPVEETQREINERLHMAREDYATHMQKAFREVDAWLHNPQTHKEHARPTTASDS